ncbi:MAG: membrane integrity-associated transporter subunit PqiC [Hyphomonadaceae bacterium]|nr:membrane integrity-associated transporter subunit PqiC [Hyphomonadaceae bacterium]MBC6412953.1 membrane integrity-associated transporter subunit PqiC [Hyphomonadaceae bacterium]
MVVGIGLSACVSVLPDPKPADTIYLLRSSVEAVTPRKDAKNFRVDRPTTPTSLQRDAIILSPDGNTYQTAGRARWSEPVPALIQWSFVDELAGHDEFIGVLPTSGVRTTHRVHLTVRNFEAQFDHGQTEAPLVVVHYIATVADASSRNLIGTFAVKSTRRADNIAISSIVNATREANQSALSDIIGWMKTLDLES